MIAWPWLILAFIAGWACHKWLFGLGFRELKRRGQVKIHVHEPDDWKTPHAR